MVGSNSLSTASSVDKWLDGVAGNFPIPQAVLGVLPEGAVIKSARRSGTSTWTRTARVCVDLPDGTGKDFFLKTITGPGARALAEGEYHSANAINATVPGMVPQAYGWGSYLQGNEEHFFYLGAFHDMKLKVPPPTESFIHKLAELHTKGVSPNGKFGFPVPTTIGKMERTVSWESSWAKSFSNQLLDDLRYDNETNGYWQELEAASKQLLAAVIPRLLGVLQSDGNNILPVLVHGDLWENNVGRDNSTQNTVLFDPGCMYAHNEMEFGTWRCTWAEFFKTGEYLELYKDIVPVSEPAEEWDDRNRLYSVHQYLTDSAGHPGSPSRARAYNDMLYLCEKYAPLDSLEKYDPEKDTEDYVPFVISQLT